MPIRNCPEINTSCPLVNSKLGCHASIHHEYYPSSQYRRPVEKEFRNLPENKEFICRAVHNEIHATQSPPPKPDLDFMREAIRRSRGEQCA